MKRSASVEPPHARLSPSSSSPIFTELCRLLYGRLRKGSCWWERVLYVFFGFIKTRVRHRKPEAKKQIGQNPRRYFMGTLRRIYPA